MNRLAFGNLSAGSPWQQKMDQILFNLPFYHRMLDDILITGRNDEEHIRTLQEIFERLQANGLHLNKAKCPFIQSKLKYCSHILTEFGIQQSPEKIAAIVNASQPTNVTQLKSGMGLIMYYHNHLPNVSSLLHPLYQLLKKNRKWHFDKSCEDAYAKVKELIANNVCLTHFEPAPRIILATDAGPRGIGAVLSHRTSSGEKLICFASRSLTEAEQNYSQLDREGLAIVWAVRKMNDYLFGRSFELITDNKPIAAILSPNKATPSMVAA
jgi:hypothetical protein